MASVIPTSFVPMRWGLGVQGRAELGGLEGRGLSDPLITLSPPLIPPYLAPRPLSPGTHLPPPSFPPPLPFPHTPLTPLWFPVFLNPLPIPFSSLPLSHLLIPPLPSPLLPLLSLPHFLRGWLSPLLPAPPISISPSQRCSAAAFRTRCLAPWQPPRAAPRALRWRRPAETSSRGSRCRS